ncbi:MAG: T9SS type A sorting domain-containing protein, partial [Bacteroidales bacterium]|nr:T9SS type A sorting domain-containing protein [Bacteroidales bacterium]
RYSNGKNTYTDGGITQLEGFIQAYSTHLIVNGQTTSTETSPASDPNLRALAQQLDHDYPAPTYMNGNDAIALFKDTGGSGDVNDFVLVDLFGIIGGGMPSDGEGWAAFTDEWVFKNIWENDSIVGRDSVFITNYIVPDGYWWIPWSSNNALVRKPGVKHGVTLEAMPAIEFDVTVEWDTVPGGVDVWDSLNAHTCDCEFQTLIEEGDVNQLVKIYPNPASGRIIILAEDGMDQVEVYDLTGKMIWSFVELHGKRENVLDVASLSPGIYMVRIHTLERTFSRKLIRR